MGFPILSRYIYPFLLLFVFGTTLVGCSDDKQSEQQPIPTKPVDYSFYRFIDHLDEALEISAPPKDINNRIVSSVRTILNETSLKPVEETLVNRNIDLSASRVSGALQKFDIRVPITGTPVNDGIASVKLHFKDSGKVAGIIFRYSENNFYFCGLQSGPENSMFLARYMDNILTIIDYSEITLPLGQDQILTVNYHGRFFEIILNNQLFRIVHDTAEPFAGTTGYFSSDPVNALAQDLKTAAMTLSLLKTSSRNLLNDITSWEQFLFYRHNRINLDLDLKRRDHCVKAELDGETRPALFLFPGGTIRFRIKIPPSGRLDYGLGVPSELISQEKIEFRLTWEGSGESKKELAKIDLGDKESGKWIDKSMDLSGWAGQEGILSFQALLSQDGLPAHTALLVSTPLLRSAVTSDKPNIIVYMVDSLRRDSLGVYGNKDGLSPNIDRWAESAAVFEQAFSQAPWVKPSVASIFLSQYPVVHTILQFNDRILARYTTLTERLAQSGYVTACFSDNPLVGAGSGIDQGFDRYSSNTDLSRIRSFISRKDQPPSFVFIHTKEPHRLHDENISNKASSLTAEKIEFISDLLSRYRNISRQNYQHRSTDISYDNSDEQTGILDKIRSHIEDYKKLYKEGVAQTDHKFGQFLDTLEQADGKENTLLVLLSPNGEEFLEHNNVMDGNSLYQELIHVPFVLSWPERWKKGRRISPPVELFDLLPTFLEIVKNNKPLVTQGTSLVPVLDGLTIYKDIYSCRINLGSFYKPSANLRGPYNIAMIRWPYKIIYNQTPDTVELFDISQDSADQNNLAETNEELVKKLKGDLNEWILIQNSLRTTLGIKKDKMMINSSLKQKFKSLGYMDL